MAQYHSGYQAHNHAGLWGRITDREYRDALQLVKQNGLTNLD